MAMYKHAAVTVRSTCRCLLQAAKEVSVLCALKRRHNTTNANQQQHATPTACCTQQPTQTSLVQEHNPLQACSTTAATTPAQCALQDAHHTRLHPDRIPFTCRCAEVQCFATRRSPHPHSHERLQPLPCWLAVAPQNWLRSRPNTCALTQSKRMSTRLRNDTCRQKKQRAIVHLSSACAPLHCLPLCS